MTMALETIDVLLTTEGTYPVEHGGVSTWCDLLIRHMPGVRYDLLTVMANPYLPLRYNLPLNVRHWLKVPLWGTEDPAESLDLETPALLERRERTTRAVVESKFLPLFTTLVEQCWAPETAPPPDLGPVMVDLHKLFQTYDYQALFKDPAVWAWYSDTAVKQLAPRRGLNPSLNDVVESLGWLYRFLTVLQAPVPRAHVTHASAASFCAIPGVVAKRLHGTPLLITEHGVYLREQYNNVGRSPFSPFLKYALLGLVEAVCSTVYAAADAVAPVAAFNTRWERELGVPDERIRVIHNGVDPAAYQARARTGSAAPMVAAIARVDPAKDLATLLRAAALVVKELPEARFTVHGAISVPAYHKQLLALRAELQLEDRFQFAGHCDDVPGAYAACDVVALSSVTEGFPYSVIEAMMCARPVVATDVGGVAEALADTGLLVPPGAPEAMAAAILRLLRDKELAGNLAAEAKRRAERLFTVERFVAEYERLYRELVPTSREG
jgi:glycosyltransferase involved in cell wall biosynthesis